MQVKTAMVGKLFVNLSKPHFTKIRLLILEFVNTHRLTDRRTNKQADGLLRVIVAGP